jgi:hypothetical protein
MEDLGEVLRVSYHDMHLAIGRNIRKRGISGTNCIEWQLVLRQIIDVCPRELAEIVQTPGDSSYRPCRGVFFYS